MESEDSAMKGGNCLSFAFLRMNIINMILNTSTVPSSLHTLPSPPPYTPPPAPEQGGQKRCFIWITFRENHRGYTAWLATGPNGFLAGSLGGLVKVPNQISKESRVYLTAYFPQASHRKSQTSSASTLLEKVLPDIAVFNWRRYCKARCDEKFRQIKGKW